MFDILNAYKKYSGKSVLINTSFNDNNEPIVFTWLDAIICFLRTNCDFLVIDGRIILRELIVNIENELIRLSNFQKLWIDTYTLEAIRSIILLAKTVTLLKSFVS